MPEFPLLKSQIGQVEWNGGSSPQRKVRPRTSAWYRLHVEATRRNLILPDLPVTCRVTHKDCSTTSYVFSTKKFHIDNSNTTWNYSTGIAPVCLPRSQRTTAETRRVTVKQGRVSQRNVVHTPWIHGGMPFPLPITCGNMAVISDDDGLPNAFVHAEKEYSITRIIETPIARTWWRLPPRVRRQPARRQEARPKEWSRATRVCRHLLPTLDRLQTGRGT